MKKVLFLSAMLLCAGSSMAQWTTNDTDYTVVGQDSVYGQTGLKSLRATDGSIVLTWLNTPKNLRYDDPAFGYYLYMQVFDQNGQPTLGKEGKALITQPTQTWVSDYGLTMAENGDIIIAYNDCRNDETRLSSEIYVYRFTLQGEPVWPAEGIHVSATPFKNNQGHNMAAQLCQSSGNIYLSFMHSENYKEKATEDNWEPSPWFPDEEMPDSIDVSYEDIQLQLLGNDGLTTWTENKVTQADISVLAPAPDGELYLIYNNEAMGLDAQRIDQQGNNVWSKAVTVEPESLTASYYMPEPAVASDNQGGLVLAYRKLTDYYGYAAASHLQPDGTVTAEAYNCVNTTDGDATMPIVATRDNVVMTSFEFSISSGQRQMYACLFDFDGPDFSPIWWNGEERYGMTIDENDMWGMKPVTIIPQQNGWVLLYGNCTSWNGANFMVVKVDDDGKELWHKQIAETDFKSSGFSVVSDNERAYIFYTCEREIGDDWEEIPGEGGLRVMCVDITDNGNNTVGIVQPTATGNTAETYNAQGLRVQGTSQAGLYIVRQGGTVRKYLKKSK